jgi:hypothetical protein
MTDPCNYVFCRLRQLRVQDSCDIDPAFQKTILYCYGPYTKSIEETGSFLPSSRQAVMKRKIVYYVIFELVCKMVKLECYLNCLKWHPWFVFYSTLTFFGLFENKGALVCWVCLFQVQSYFIQMCLSDSYFCSSESTHQFLRGLSRRLATWGRQVWEFGDK